MRTVLASVSIALLLTGVAMAADGEVPNPFLLSPPAASSMSASEAVSTRQADMKADGRALRTATTASGEDAAKALETIHENYLKLPALFPEGSITGDSKALPVIWTDWANFAAIFAKGANAAKAGIKAARAGDTQAYAASVETIKDTCGACHMTYRAKRD